jgi:hypothetical protein
MVTEVRYHLDEPTAVSWSDAELLVYLNHAQAWAQSLILGLDQDFFLTSTNLTTTANTATIALPSDFMRVKRLEWLDGDTSLKNPEPLYPIEWQNKGMGWPMYYSGTNTGGRPYYFYFQGTNLVLWPVPDTTKAAALRMWYIYRLADLAGAYATCTCEVPSEWHKTVVLKAAIQAMMKMEQDTSVFKRELDEQTGMLMRALSSRQMQEPRFIRDVFGDS